MPQVVLTMRLPPADHAAASALAASQGETVSLWARSVIVGHINGTTPRPKPERAARSKVAPEVREAAQLIAALGRLTDAVTATSGDLSAETAHQIRAASRAVVAYADRLP